MGQYYNIINVTKEEYLNPRSFHEGLKFIEFSNSSGGSLMALALLLSDTNGSGGGDFRGYDPDGLKGSWAGDSIVVAGDYGEAGKLFGSEVGMDGLNLYEHCGEEFKDISLDILKVMMSSHNY